MRNHTWDDTGSQDFEALLESALPELPPGDVVAAVTPWKTAMHRVLLGMALCAITLHFWLLDTLLPTAGMVLALLGFRSLRRENRWFQGCWVLFCCRAVLFFPWLVWWATRLPSTDWGGTLSALWNGLSALLLLLMVFCLWRGLVEIQRRAGQPPHAGAAGALLVWYGLVCLLGALPDLGLFVGLGLFVAYFAILYGLYRLTDRLEAAGYVVRPLPLRVSDRRLVGGILLALALALGCAYLLGGTYSMDWQPAAPSTQAQETRDHLAELGFPQDLLADLTDQDIADCAGATQVAFVWRDYPMAPGRLETTQTATGTVTDTVYDQKELRLTGVCVRLSEEEGTWRLFQFFQWVEEPDFWGTESIRILPAYRQYWNQISPVTGRVLYDRDGTTYAAPYAFLDSQTYTQQSPLFGGQQTSTELFAAFSLPRQGENKRGYLTYAIQPVTPGLPIIVDSPFQYTHQISRWQYPVQTAMDHQMAGSWGQSRVFCSAQDSLQFYSDAGQPW